MKKKSFGCWPVMAVVLGVCQNTAIKRLRKPPPCPPAITTASTDPPSGNRPKTGPLPTAPRLRAADAGAALPASQPIFRFFYRDCFYV